MDREKKPRESEEMRELHAELSKVRITERPSFGPELEAELARRWREMRSRRHPRFAGSRPRTFALAASVVLMLGALSVPPARGAIVRLLRATVELAVPQPEIPEEAVGRSPAVAAPASEIGSPPLAEEEAASERRTVRVERDPLATPAPPAREPAEDATVYPAPVVYPEVRDREEARRVVSRYYPEELARAGVGGVVQLLLHVAQDGRPTEWRVGRSSGIPALDRAALNAARRLRFNPGRLQGRAVPTWVAFDLRFEPGDLRTELSGLLMVEPGENVLEVASAAGFPLPSTVPASPGRSQLGVVYEIFDLPPEEEHVEVRVFLEDRTWRERSSLPFRPMGEREFRRAWDRPSRTLRAGVDCVTVDLSRVNPGSYQIIVQVRLPGRDQVLESSGGLMIQ